MKDEKGFALVITLLVTALLVALTAEFTTEVFVDTTSRHNFVAGQQAGMLAESGITGGVKLLQLSLNNKSYNSLNDQWAKPIKISDEWGDLLISIEDESGKLNLNQVAPPNGEIEGSFSGAAALRFFKALKIEGGKELTDALADWIDINDYPHPGGAESDYYGSLTPPYNAKNGQLDTLDELNLVKGFPGRVMEKIRPFATVYTDTPNAPVSPVNINSAPKEVLMALDERITLEMADRVIDYRASTPFTNPAELAKVPGFENIATGLQTNISVKGNVYRFRSEGRVREVSRTIEAVVRLGGTRPQFIYWREY